MKFLKLFLAFFQTFENKIIFTSLRILMHMCTHMQRIYIYIYIYILAVVVIWTLLIVFSSSSACIYSNVFFQITQIQYACKKCVYAVSWYTARLWWETSITELGVQRVRVKFGSLRKVIMTNSKQPGLWSKRILLLWNWFILKLLFEAFRRFNPKKTRV